MKLFTTSRRASQHRAEARRRNAFTRRDSPERRRPVPFDGLVPSKRHLCAPYCTPLHSERS